MRKIALVNHRYGAEISSGSEMLCMLLAKRLSKDNEVEVLTTCALDDNTWANHYQEGVSEDEGILVRRFRTRKTRDWTFYNNLDQYIDENDVHIVEDEIKWIIDQGPYVPDLCDYVHRNYKNYDAIIFMTYLYYTSAVCMLGIPNAIFMPTAHDEKAIRLPFYKQTFSSPSAYIFLTPEEGSFVQDFFPFTREKKSIVGAYGIDIPANSNAGETYSGTPYILYAGRITPAKGCDSLLEHFTNFVSREDIDIKLVLIGKSDIDLPQNEKIDYRGFVSEEEKMELMQEASLLVLPSKYESLSIVVLESLTMGTPVLVNEECAVTAGHVRRSQAGYCYHDYDSFAAALKDAVLGGDCYLSKKSKARTYIEEHYSWPEVIASVENLIDSLNYIRDPEGKTVLPEEHTAYPGNVPPAFSDNNIPIVLASDNNYVEVLSVALQSVIDTAHDSNNYDIVILSDAISDFNKKMLYSMSRGKHNIRIRFLEVCDYLNAYKFDIVNKRISRATFMRLLILDLLPNYEKIVYLDCDIIVQRDISCLYENDIGSNYFGVVADPHIIQIWKFRPNVESHLRENVKISDPCGYFNAGILLMNLQELRKKYTSKDLLDIATSRKWMWEDQDVLNHIGNNKVTFLNRRWNVLWVACPNIMQLMKTDSMYVEALDDPWIIHYAGGVMPVSQYGERFYLEYVNTARKSPFYELITGKIQNSFNNSKALVIVQSVNIGRKEKIRFIVQNAKKVLAMHGSMFFFKCSAKCLKELIVAPKGQRFSRMISVYKTLKQNLK